MSFPIPTTSPGEITVFLAPLLVLFTLSVSWSECALNEMYELAGLPTESGMNTIGSIIDVSSV